MKHADAHDTARSVEDETGNTEFNGNRNPEWWGDFSNLVKIEKIEFFGIARYKDEMRRKKIVNGCQVRGISRYKFKLRFLFHLNLQLTKISPPFRILITI